jgi:hypothetical protein
MFGGFFNNNNNRDNNNSNRNTPRDQTNDNSSSDEDTTPTETQTPTTTEGRILEDPTLTARQQRTLTNEDLTNLRVAYELYAEQLRGRGGVPYSWETYIATERDYGYPALQQEETQEPEVGRAPPLEETNLPLENIEIVEDNIIEDNEQPITPQLLPINLPNFPTMDTIQFNQLLNALTGLTTQLGQQPQNINQNPPQNNNNSPRINVPIPVYRGETKENVAAWLMQVETIFNAQQINDAAIRCYYASTGMKGAALHWYLQQMTIHGNIGVPWADWNAFKTAVTTAFQPPNYQQYLRKQLRKLRQTGSVRDYTTQFQDIVGQITDMSDLDQVTQYSEGLKPSTRMEIDYQAPANLTQAIGLAIRYDSAMWGNHRSSGKPSRSNISSNYNRNSAPRNNNSGGPIPMELDLMTSANRNHTDYQCNKYPNTSNKSSNFSNSNNKRNFK